MIRVQFNDSASMIDADFKLISDSAVQLSGKKVKPNTSGFKAYRLNGDFLGDYSDYKKIAKEEKGCVQFSK